MNATAEFRVWCIGSVPTEYYAARSEDEIRQYYTAIVGEKQAQKDIGEHFEEVPASELDKGFYFCKEGGRTITTTWRKLMSGLTEPCQIGTDHY